MQNGAATSTKSKKWSDLVDDFGPMKPEAAACLATVVSQTRARNALYVGTMDPTPEEKAAGKGKEARVDFLDYLQTVIMPKLERQQPANENGIKLADLLGPEGMKKYKAAVEEEVQSRAFRDAVFQRSTNHYPGEKWDKRVIAPFAGPSAAGKSVSQPALIAEIAKVVPKKADDNSGNDVVSIDGGVEREVSQIRGMVLQVALAKGYRVLLI